MVYQDYRAKREFQRRQGGKRHAHAETARTKSETRRGRSKEQINDQNKKGIRRAPQTSALAQREREQAGRSRGLKSKQQERRLVQPAAIASLQPSSECRGGHCGSGTETVLVAVGGAAALEEREQAPPLQTAGVAAAELVLVAEQQQA